MDSSKRPATEKDGSTRPYPEVLLEKALGIIRLDLAHLGERAEEGGLEPAQGTKLARYTEVLLSASKKNFDELMKADPSSPEFYDQLESLVPPDVKIEWAARAEARARRNAAR